MIIELNEKETEGFKVLRQSEMSNFLIDYCERLRTFLRDFKNWPDRNTETIKAVELADKLIEDNLVNRLKIKNLKKSDERNPWE
jgi:hypothetical protein